MWLRLGNVEEKKHVCLFILLENSRSLFPSQEPQTPLSSGTPGLLIHLPRKWLSESWPSAQVFPRTLLEVGLSPWAWQRGQWAHGQVVWDLRSSPEGEQVLSMWPCAQFSICKGVFIQTLLMAQQYRTHLPVLQTQLWSVSWEDPLEKGMATHSCVLAWRIPGTEEPGGLQSVGLQRVRQDLVIKPPPHSNTPHPSGIWIYVHLTWFTQTKKNRKERKSLELPCTSRI